MSYHNALVLCEEPNDKVKGILSSSRGLAGILYIRVGLKHFGIILALKYTVKHVLQYL